MASQSGRVETFWRTREDVFSFRSGRGNGSGNSSLQRTMVQRKRHRAEDDRDVFSQIQGLPEITPSEAYRQSCQKDRSSVLIEKSRSTDAKRFIQENRCTDDGVIAEHRIFTLDETRIAQEERFDGFYAVCTNLEDDAQEIVRVNQRRWQIEECFRIMKHEFKARPAYLQNDDRVKAHFMTCFIALIVYRYLDLRLGGKYTAGQLIHQLRDMNMTKLEGYGYIPSYNRNELTDSLHHAFGFDTSKELIPIAKMRNICKQTKNKTISYRKDTPWWKTPLLESEKGAPARLSSYFSKKKEPRTHID